MTNTAVLVWTPQEQDVARNAFDTAQDRAISTLIGKVQRHASGLSSVESIWQLHDFLSTQRFDMEGRFDFRLEGILFVFAGFVKDGLLDLQDLQGLDMEKLAKIKAMSLF